MLRDFDGDRSDEHRLPDLVALLDVLEHRVVLRFLGLEDEVVPVVARDLDVRRDLDDIQVVDLDELLLLGLRGTGHPGELLVEAEVVLERDRRERDVLLLDRHALLGLDRLVEALRPAAAFHDPARELVDDLDLAVLDDVVDVALEERLRLQRLVQVVHELHVAGVVEVLDPERALDLVDRGLGRRDRLELLVVEVVGARALGLVDALALALLLAPLAGQRLHDAREVVVDLRSGLRLAGDDQRRPGLVDQDRVDLVHDREGVAALDGALERDGHVVAQVVEAELGVRPVRDVGRVRVRPLGERHHVLDEAGADPERVVDGLDPLRIAFGEVVVDRDEMDVLPRERVQVERHRGDEGLSFARLHLGDVALVEDDPAHHLDVEEADAHRPLERLAHRRERLEEDVLERLAVRDALPELGGLALQLLVGELLELGLERADVLRLMRSRLSRRPSPTRRKRSNPPKSSPGIVPRVSGQSRMTVTSQRRSSRRLARSTNEPNCSAAKPRGSGSTPWTGLVDEQRPRLVGDHELDLVAVHVLGHLDHLDALRGDAPDVGVLAQPEGVVRSGAGTAHRPAVRAFRPERPRRRRGSRRPARRTRRRRRAARAPRRSRRRPTRARAGSRGCPRPARTGAVSRSALAARGPRGRARSRARPPWRAARGSAARA